MELRGSADAQAKAKEMIEELIESFKNISSIVRSEYLSLACKSCEYVINLQYCVQCSISAKSLMKVVVIVPTQSSTVCLITNRMFHQMHGVYVSFDDFWKL